MTMKTEDRLQRELQDVVDVVSKQNKQKRSSSLWDGPGTRVLRKMAVRDANEMNLSMMTQSLIYN